MAEKFKETGPEAVNIEKASAELLQAASKGDLWSMERALKSGADVNAKNEHGWTPLMFAASHADIVKALIEKGADVNAKSKDGITAIMLASFRNNSNTVKMLIEKGADVNAKSKVSLTPGDATNFVMLIDIDGLDPFAKALAAEHRLQMPKLMDTEKDDVGIKDEKGWTALMVAASTGHGHIAEMLIDNGADMEAKYKGGKTALMVAAEFGRASTASTLIKNGADVNAKDERDRTALEYAIDAKNEKLAVLIVKKRIEQKQT